MAYEQKTKPTETSVTKFIEQIESAKKKEDAYRLLDLFHEATGLDPVLWGPSIIGYGTYEYKYASGHSGKAPIAGFSPRKAAHSIYLTNEEDRMTELLAKLGKHRKVKSCIYINKLADIDEAVLKQMIRENMVYMEKMYPTSK